MVSRRKKFNRIMLPGILLINSCAAYSAEKNYIKDEFMILRENPSVVKSVEFSPGDEYFMLDTWDNNIEVYDSNWNKKFNLSENKDKSGYVKFIDNKRMISISNIKGKSPEITIFNIENKEIIQRLSTQGSDIIKVSLSPDKKYLAAAGNDGSVIIWDYRKNKYELLTTMAAHQSAVYDITFSENNIMATAGGDKTIKIWQLNGNEPVQLQTMECHTGSIFDLDFSPESSMLASGSADTSIFIWKKGEDNRYRVYKVLKGHSGNVYSLTFSPDGKFLATGSEDKTIRIWSMAEGFQNIQTVKNHSGPVYSLSYNSTGNLLASGSGDHTVKIWAVGK